jgi:LAO/AO transport system kinase
LSEGVGQAEQDVSFLVDTTAVVLSPDSGDGIQMMKAGLLERADVFVVNKSDRPGAEEVVQALTAAETLTETAGRPILSTVAIDGAGVGDLVRVIRDRGRTEPTPDAVRLLLQRYAIDMLPQVLGESEIDAGVEAVIQRSKTIADVARHLIDGAGQDEAGR